MMMKYYRVEPEVAGGWGKHTIHDESELRRPPFVLKLHYVFDGWLGDELLESSGCYIITERLAQEINREHLTGARFDDVEISTSGEYDDLQELHPDRQLPKFLWLRPIGELKQDDFAIDGLRLIVSERALELLKRVGLSHAASITLFES
jgi:hypothetical protein